MDSNIVVVDGKVRTPKEYINFYLAWSHKNIESTHKNIWNFFKINIKLKRNKEIKFKQKWKVLLTLM
jgi:hypothetical protein